MAENTTPALLITANVGSIFEDPSVMLKMWTEEFLSTVSRLDPKFLALHCQEVGGKNYEQSMKHVEYFVRLLMTSEELRLFDKVRVFLDEDYSSAENFTALGNFYFIHESIPDVLIWDFKEFNFVAVEGKEVHSGNIEDVPTKEKSKFPQDFFPECKWSRKGFLRTRWNLNGTIFDLVNIHLFHDASNFVAMEAFPSVYSKTRQRALEYTLDRFHNDGYGPAPFFLFGDFNFRTDTQGVIRKLADGLKPVQVQSPKNNDHTKLQYKDDTSQVILTLGKKEFSHHDHQNVFIENAAGWLKEFDKEMECFLGQLFEFNITFPPSYPYEEDSENGCQYMQTRCPAWCDRVVLSETAKHLVHKIDEGGSIEYGAIGENTSMGDHKPVYLRIDLLGNAGRVVCCSNQTLVSSSHDATASPSLLQRCTEFVIVEPPSVLAKQLERTDSSSSICIIETKNNIFPKLISAVEQQQYSGSDDDDTIKDENNSKRSSENSKNSSIKCDLQSVTDSSSNSDVIVSNTPLNLPTSKCLPKDIDKTIKLSTSSRLSSDKNFDLDYIKDIDFGSSIADEVRSYDRYVVKRVQSASFVEVPRVGALKQSACRCASESQSWRARSVSISSRTTNWRSNSRVKLISDPNLQSSLLRLQSHHSSSDEDWFEEISVDGTIEENVNKNCNNGKEDEDNDSVLRIDVTTTSSTMYAEENVLPYEPAVVESLQTDIEQPTNKIVLDNENPIQKQKTLKNCFHLRRKKKRKLEKCTSGGGSAGERRSENKENLNSNELNRQNCCIIS